MFGCNNSVEDSEIRQKEDLTYEQAKALMNEFISFNGKRYELKAKKASEVGISEAFFVEFKELMDETNQRIAGEAFIEIEKNMLVPLVQFKKQFVRLKTRSEVSPGGIDCYYEYWAGCHLYVSNNTLKRIRDGFSITSAAIAAGASRIAAAAIAAVNACFVDRYPNGIDFAGEWYDENGEPYVFKRWSISEQQ